MSIPLHFDFRRSIQARIAAVIGFICFLFFVGFAWGLGEALRVREERTARAEIEGLSQRMAHLLDETMYGRYRDIEIAANLPSLRNTSMSPTIQRQIFQSVQDAHREFAWIGLTDADGIVRVSTGGHLEGVDVSTRPWFEGGRSQPFFGDVHDALLLDSLLRGDGDEPLRFVDIAVPVYDSNQEFAGVLGAHLSWKWAADILRAVLVPFSQRPGLEAFILGADGTVLLSDMASPPPDFEPLLARVNAMGAVNGYSALEQLTPDESHLVGFTRSQGYGEYPGLGWQVVVLQPVADAFAVAHEVQRSILVWGFGISALLVMVLWVITHSIVHPLTVIARAADTIRREGNGGEMPLIPGQDEIASLSQALHTLIGRLRNSVDRLQALHTIDRAIMQTDELSVTLDVVVKQTQQMLAVDAVNILLLDPQTDDLRYAAGIGFRTDAFRQAAMPVGSGIRSRIMAERKTIFIDDVTTTAGIVRADAFRAEEFAVYVGTPLVNQKTLVGVLELHQRGTLTPDDDWREFLNSLALQTAIAIQHARLLVETRNLLNQSERQARELGQILESVPGGVLLLDSAHAIRHQNSVGQTYLATLARRSEDGRLQGLGARALDDLLIPVQPGAPWHEVADGAKVYEVAASEFAAADTSGQWVLSIIDVTLERQYKEHSRRQDRLATVGQLAAGIAHDFNNILTPIFLYSHLLERSTQDDKVRTGMQNIVKAATRAKELIQQILAFSRGRKGSDAQLIQLQPIIGEVLALLEAVLPASIVLEQKVAPQVGAIRGDGTQIHQVLMNLCTNAYQAMPNGGVLTIGLQGTSAQKVAEAVASQTEVEAASLKNAAYAHLWVSDTGLGMERATLARIYEPFFTTKAPGEGTGMGLAMVHDVIQEHDGLINVESVVGEGTTFHVYLPLQTETAADRQAVTVLAEGGKIGHLLIVDDEETILVALKEALEANGYRVTAMRHSQDALAAVRAAPYSYDLIVTDLNMPGLMGDDLIMEIRQIRPDARCILMSGSSKLLSGARVQCVQATGVVSKPFTMQEIIQAIQVALAQAKGTGNDGKS